MVYSCYSAGLVFSLHGAGSVVGTVASVKWAVGALDARMGTFGPARAGSAGVGGGDGGGELDHEFSVDFGVARFEHGFWPDSCGLCSAGLPLIRGVRLGLRRRRRRRRGFWGLWSLLGLRRHRWANGGRMGGGLCS